MGTFFLIFEWFCIEIAIIDYILRPMVFLEHASGFRVVIDSDGEEKTLKFIKISLVW